MLWGIHAYNGRDATKDGGKMCECMGGGDIAIFEVKEATKIREDGRNGKL